jgi:hypothetical protein
VRERERERQRERQREIEFLKALIYATGKKRKKKNSK